MSGVPLALPCLIVAGLLTTGALNSPEPPAQPAEGSPAAPPPPVRENFKQKVPGAAFEIEMIAIPGSKDGTVQPMWVSRTEITWEAMDAYVFSKDVEAGQTVPGLDAVSRPSKPYIPPDRGFGHDGYAVISCAFKNADGFCKWLSVQSGKSYRLPTDAEWEHACRAGAGTTKYFFGDDASQLGEYAWFADNSDGAPHPVGQKKPNAFGLCDTLGNVREWCVVDGATKPVACGGSFQEPAEEVACATRHVFDRSWQASDPQVPKSKWWLSDAPFAGFRIVCDGDTPKEQPAAK